MVNVKKVTVIVLAVHCAALYLVVTGAIVPVLLFVVAVSVAMMVASR